MISKTIEGKINQYEALDKTDTQQTEMFLNILGSKRKNTKQVLSDIIPEAQKADELIKKLLKLLEFAYENIDYEYECTKNDCDSCKECDLYADNIELMESLIQKAQEYLK
jgi:hypothetical protein